MTQAELANLFMERLSSIYDEGETRAITRLVFEEVFRNNGEDFFSKKQQPVSETQLALCVEMLSRLEENEPVQYVLGFVWFCGLKLVVNNNVLIPRPETEELVQYITDDLKKKNLRILDIGTGSGCIAIALKKLIPQASVAGIDISEESLAIARLNANQHLLAVNFHQLDILNHLLHTDFINTYEKFDVIVSNPPYIAISEMASLNKNVTAYEPHKALFVPDNDVLLFYRSIVVFSKTFLQPDGLIYFEIHQHQADNVSQLLKEQGFDGVQIVNDLSGNPRFVKAIHL